MIRVHVVERFAGVLLQMDVIDSHPPRDSRIRFDDDLSRADDGVVQLRNLVALRQVRIKIIFSVEG